MDFASFYKGKRVLVTGADGFMGSHLTEKLVNFGAHVTIFVRGNSTTGTHTYQLKNINHLKERLVGILAGDIGSIDTIHRIKSIRPQIIFHLAAEAYVNRSFIQPREVIRTNSDGTLNILHAALTPEMKLEEYIERIVITSSSEIYGHSDDRITEDHPLNPSTPYGASKLAADRFAYSYWNTFKLPIAIVRPFNTYGPRHTYDAPPKFIGLALEGKDITIYGNGDQTRDLSYVDDTVCGFLLMGAHKDAVGQAVNFGTGKDIKIIDLAKMIIKLTGSSSKIVHLPPRLGEVSRLCSNPEKAKKLFGWEAKVSLEDGLKKNLEWIRKNKQ